MAVSMAAFVLAGIGLLGLGRADTPFADSEIESAELSGNASYVIDLNASQYVGVRFGDESFQADRPEATVSFTFDDGFANVLSQAAPALAKYDLAGTSYITTGCVGMTAAPNTCRANKNEAYLSWPQVKQLRDEYGWEIGSHTVSHPLLASSDASDQPGVLTRAQVRKELTDSKAALAAQGIDATAFAAPYGDYSPMVQAEVARLYSSHRGFHDDGMNVWPHDNYLIRVMPVQAGVSVAAVKAAINQAIDNQQWLVLVFHGIKQSASSDPGKYEYATSQLEEIAGYAAAKQLNGSLKVKNVSSALPYSGINGFIGGGDFDTPFTEYGWQTDEDALATPDNQGNGRVPTAATSIRIQGGTNTETHLFSPEINTEAARGHLFSQYLNIPASGEVGFYVDEYDESGTWTSGQYLKTVKGPFAGQVSFRYDPTTIGVRYARLQVIVKPGTVAYYDNAAVYQLPRE